MSHRKFLSQDRQLQVDAGWEPRILGGYFFLFVFALGTGADEGYNDLKWSSRDKWLDRPSMTVQDIADTLGLWEIKPPDGLFRDLEDDERTDDSSTTHWYLEDQSSV